MGVEDSLTRGRTGVEHEAVLVQTIGARHVARDAHQLSHGLGLGVGQGRRVGVVRARDDQGVGGGLRVQVAEGYGRPGLRDHVGRDLARDDPAEQAVGVRGPGVRHDSSSHGHAEVNPQSRSSVGLA